MEQNTVYIIDNPLLAAVYKARWLSLAGNRLWLEGDSGLPSDTVLSQCAQSRQMSLVWACYYSSPDKVHRQMDLLASVRVTAVPVSLGILGRFIAEKHCDSLLRISARRIIPFHKVFPTAFFK